MTANMVLVTVVALLSILVFTVQCTDFDRNLFGVRFDPFVKFGEYGDTSRDTRDYPPSSNYTLENLRTMLEIVSTKFTRIITTDLGAPWEPYIRNYTYYNTESINARAAEAAALINCGRNKTSLTVVVGAVRSYGIQIETELHVAAEAAQIANSIYPGTVTGIVLWDYSTLDLKTANYTLFWIQKLQVMTEGFGLKIGMRVNYQSIQLQKQNDEGFEGVWSLQKQILLLLDFLVYRDFPSKRDIKRGTNGIFQKVRSDVKEYRNAIKKVNPKLDVMWDTYWPGKEGKPWYTIENFKYYWESANKFAIKEKIPVWLDGAFNNPRLYESHSGWWKLTQNELIDDVSGYVEKVSGNIVHIKFRQRFDCRGNLGLEPIPNSMLEAINSSVAPDKSSLPLNATDSKFSNQTISLGHISSGALPKYSGFFRPQESQNLTSYLPENVDDSEEIPKPIIMSNRNTISLALVTSAGSVSVFLVLLYFIVTRIGRFRNSKILTPGEIDEFRFGRSKSHKLNNGKEGVDTLVPTVDLPYDNSIEVPKGQLKIFWDERLGRGEFGLVYKGLLKDEKDGAQDVAVKLPKQDSISISLKGLLSEIKILMYLRRHPNIVSLLGAYTAEVGNGVAYVALELCELGSLYEYLKNLAEAKQTMSISIDLMRWSYDIVCGMEHLEKKNVLHADLATRNVLLTSDKTAKITDFGLSRRLYEYSNYKKRSKSPIPWRWLPVESLKSHVFSVKSDVWSYGVTLWEIFSYGELPFPEKCWDDEFMWDMENGLRLSQPSDAPKEMYEIMSSCWNLAPDDRPSFADLCERTKRNLEETIIALQKSGVYTYSEFLE